MAVSNRFFAGVRALFSRRRTERDLDDELRAYLDASIEQKLAAGLSREESVRAARLECGSLEAAKDGVRDVGWESIVVATWQDVRYAVRLLRKTPAFAAVAIVTLGFGIGANGAIFSVFDALMLRTLPVSHPEQLVNFGIDLSIAQARPFTRWNYADFTQIRDGLPAVSAVTAVGDLDRSNIRVDGFDVDAGPVHVALVSGNYFSLFGASAHVGRTFGPDDDRVPGRHPVAVISDRYWQRRLQRTDVAGRQLKLNETTYTILGVMPAAFVGDWVGHPVDVWIPMAMQSEVMTERPGLLSSRGSTWLRIVARRQPHATPDAVEAAANAVMSSAAPGGTTGAVLSAPDRQQMLHSRIVVASEARGFSDERRDLGTPMVIVLAIVGLLLLIACANVANLQLARATARRTEIALRAALGASRARLLSQALAESAMLAVCAGSVGLVVAMAGTEVLGRFIGSGPTSLSLELHLDARLLLLIFATTLCTTAIAGIAPAAIWWHRPLLPALAGRTATGAGAGLRFRSAKTLVIVQVALSMVLLIGAGLFVRTLRNLQTQDLGLDRSHVLVVQAAPDQQGLTGSGIAELMDRLPEQLRALPGARAVAASSFAALGGIGSGSRCTVAGYTYREDEDNFVRSNTVTPHYFETMGMPLVAGRDIRADDTDAHARVAVVNETMARYYWHSVNVVGRRFGLGRDSGNEIEIIGVVRDASTEWLRERPERTVFLPYRQQVDRLRSFALAVRTNGPAAALRPLVRERLRLLAPQLPVVSLRTVDENMDQMLLTERLVALLSGLFGGLALMLTCLGLYGVMSYITARRTQEIGIRMALGAGRAATISLVMKESLRQVFIGLALGVPAALLLMRALRAVLFGVTVTDAPTIATAVMVMVMVAATASYLPARRATRVSALAALRCD